MSAYPKAVAQGWHPVARSTEIGRKPLAVVLMDRPIVLFRTAGGVAALEDRCPHRNMALSSGRVIEGAIECPYHGWRFGADGACLAVPGSATPARHGATALPAEERAGLVWTTLAADPQPFSDLPHPVAAQGFDVFWWKVRPSRARLIDAIENLLDPAHPHFLHDGIVRSRARRRPVEVTVRLGEGVAEAAYVENARASALTPRVLEGRRTVSYGRFYAPATGQIAFEGEKGLKLAITVFFTPVSADRVQPFAHFATPEGPVPALVKEALLRAFHIPVLAQDRAALSRQLDTITRFGGPRYALGPLDYLLPAIQALADGEQPPPSETRFRAEF